MEELYDLDLIQEQPKLTAEFVLSKIDDVLIFRFYIGEFKLGRPIKSPFGLGTRPNFSIIFNDRWMKLMWKCFHSSSSGDCFGLVSKLFNLTYYQAIERVATDFGLVKGRTISKKLIEEAKAFKENFKKESLLIQIDIRAMNSLEREYWNQFGIFREDLKTNHIYAIKNLWINKVKIYLNESQLHFGYFFKTLNTWKIYSPYDKERKWVSNTPNDTIEGITPGFKGFDITKPILVTKSRKDRICTSKIYKNVISSQNESENSIPLELDKLLEIFPKKVILWDSDLPGKEACKKLNKRGYGWLNLPNNYYEDYQIKDFSDLILKFGVVEAQKIMKEQMRLKQIT